MCTCGENERGQCKAGAPGDEASILEDVSGARSLASCSHQAPVFIVQTCVGAGQPSAGLGAGVQTPAEPWAKGMRPAKRGPHGDCI